MTPDPRRLILGTAGYPRGSAMGDDQTDLAEIVIQFLEARPATIIPEILYFILLYGLDANPSREPSEHLPVIQDSFRKAGGMKKMSTTIRVIAALDYYLWRSAVKIRDAKVSVESSQTLEPALRDRLLTE
jgi:hypothetical protein